MLISWDGGSVFSETWVLVRRHNMHAPISFVSSYYGARNWVTQRGGAWGIIDRSVLGCCGGREGGRGGNASTERAPHASRNHDTSCSVTRSSAGMGFIDLCTQSVDSKVQELWDVRVLNSGGYEDNSVLGCADVSERPAACVIGVD
jgi:hypothetical protein